MSAFVQENPATWTVGSITLQNVHRPEMCFGRPCIIHAPSDHHMRDWTLVWRDDKHVFERTCRHGVGHPDPDEAAHLQRIGLGSLTIHGCCGCCRAAEAVEDVCADCTDEQACAACMADHRFDRR